MPGIWDNLAGGLYNAKTALGLQDVNLFPGDVTKALTGASAQYVYGSPTSTPGVRDYSQPGLTSVGGYKASTPTTTGGGDTGGNGGGNGNTSTGTNVPNSGGQPVPPSVDEAAISAVFDPIIQNLNAYQSALTGRRQFALDQVGAGYNQSLSELDNRQTEGLRNLGGQRTETQDNQRSAISAARQLFNELSQSNLARFGGRSGLAQGVSEILGRSTAQQIGGINQAANNAYGDISQQETDLKDFIQGQKVNLTERKALAEQSVLNDFEDRIAEIDNRRGQAESAKAAAKLDALQTYRNQLFQLQQAEQAFQNQLTMFQQQASAELANQFALDNGISKEALDIIKTFTDRGLPIAQAAEVAGVQLPTGVISTVNDPNFVNPLNYSKLKPSIFDQFATAQLGNTQ